MPNRSGLLSEKAKQLNIQDVKQQPCSHMGSDVINAIFNILHHELFWGGWGEALQKLPFLFHFIISTVLLVRISYIAQMSQSNTINSV